MATRTILSPGVEIFEKDLSVTAPQNVGTNIFISGFAAQGPVDEVLKITSESEFVNIYGRPTNSAERYFYHGINNLLNSPAHIYTSRLPYGANSGVGFGSYYSLLAYPAKTVSNALSSDVTDFSTLSSVDASFTNEDATAFLGTPTHFTLTEDEYDQLKEGTLFTWSVSGCNYDHLSATNLLGYAGVIVVNKAQTTVNDQFEGYYVGLADNTSINPATAHTSIQSVETISASSITSSYTEVPDGTLVFQLTATASGINGSVSEVMENLTTYDIDGREHDDILNVGVFKLRKSLYATESYKLDYVLDSAVVGSFDYHRTKSTQDGGLFVSSFLENEDDKDRNVEILVNPYLSNKFTGTTVGVDGIPDKKIRVLTHSLSSLDNSIIGLWEDMHDVSKDSLFATLVNDLGYADSLFPVSTYTNANVDGGRDMGDIPAKVERALEAVINDEIYDIDVVVEAGLGTMHVITEATGDEYYDDTLYNDTIVAAISELRTSNPLTSEGESVRSNYMAVFNKFYNFCGLPSDTGGRGDCIFIADPIRHILVTGDNNKVVDKRSATFQTDIYWAMRHQFETVNTSYATTYATWGQVYDDFLGSKVWIPFSTVAGAVFARNDAAEFPWSAPAGYTRGLVGGDVLDIAITPNQKQRDELYKSNLNPVLFSPSQGMAIFGQKTFSRKPSAFDRINVRRCFFALERPTKKVSKFFVFEPNNEFTRTRFVNTLTPIFEYAKNNGGIYRYLIVADERVNTPEVIDANELRANLYVAPTRTSEYIILTFVATRTDANFEELI